MTVETHVENREWRNLPNSVWQPFGLVALPLRGRGTAPPSWNDMAHGAAHIALTAISRSAGRSAVAAAAYRHGVKATDERTGVVHDYTRKGGVVAGGVVGWTGEPAELWNAAEAAENRRNSQVARELTLALPNELSDEARARVMRGMCLFLRDRHGVAASWVLHTNRDKPEVKRGAEPLNEHGHLMFTTRRVDESGTFGAKTRELNDRTTSAPAVEAMRAEWAKRCNSELVKAGHKPTVEHTSLKRRAEARGEPVPASLPHRGPAQTAILRRWKRQKAKAVVQKTPPPPEPQFRATERALRKANAELMKTFRDLKAVRKELDGRVRDEGGKDEAAVLDAVLTQGPSLADIIRAGLKAAEAKRADPEPPPPAPALTSRRTDDERRNAAAAAARRMTPPPAPPPSRRSRQDDRIR